MGVVLALPKLIDDVDALLATEAAAEIPPVDPVPSAFGWRAPAQRAGKTHRIVWVPGDDQSGNAGDVGPARQPGRDPRPLYTLGEVFTTYLEAVDTSEPENELKQYQAARELFDTWLRAVHHVAHGTVAVRSVAWVVERKERRYGAALRVLGVVEAMVPDLPTGIAPVDVAAELDVSVHDVTETVTHTAEGS